ncbi:MAG TPA: L,D-transpeptidase family protein [Gemmatimonadales bacterium]|jgi:murein L,D-transpeptidase YcbB/YkuD|nr:L,D-transpeptidase family protein [Gemmatimonadales bacterium]
MLRLAGRPLLAAVCLAACGCEGTSAFGGRAKSSRMEPVVRVIETVSRTGRGLPGPVTTAGERTQLRQLYQGSANMPLWLNASGDLRTVGKAAIQLLINADKDGLRPEDYAANQLESLAQRTGAEKSAAPDTVGRLDAGLSLALLRYLRDIHAGRVNPRSVGLAMQPPRERHDYVVLLGRAAREGDLGDVVAELEPPLAQYRLVRDALARLRKQGVDSIAETPLTIPVPLKAGAAVPGLDALARRLVETGDLPAQSATASFPRYEGILLDAVRRFQYRHGLAPDTVLGKETVQELNVPLSWRAHQLELALERLRWLRDLANEPFLLVNIPMFELTAWNSPSDQGPPAFRTGVIVGKALDTETPVLVEEMRYIIFQPYWNIPLSIARDETIPDIEKNRDFLRKNDMEIVQGQGDDADPVELSDEALERVARGELRIRQRPGPENALGPIKFVFPNDQNVYLHGTPAEQLFDRSRRDFSHGCVRVEDPTGLAEWVLRDQPEWTRERIVDAMDDLTRKSRRVSLARPLTVLLFYSTAVVEADGTMRFGQDIYGHDRRLDGALHLASR